MVFSSLIFLYAFLPLSLLCYALCPTLRAKNLSLLVFSLIFYAWGEPKYVLLLMLMAAVDWFCALRIEASSGDSACSVYGDPYPPKKRGRAGNGGKDQG